MAKGRSVSKISKELETVVEKMKKMAKEFAEADGAKKQKITAELKSLTSDKKMLEKELESAVAELDKFIVWPEGSVTGVITCAPTALGS